MPQSQVVRIHEFGAPDTLKLDTVTMPHPGNNELLVRVIAASINPVDYKIRSGAYPAVNQNDLPISMGRDLSGVVEEVGDSVKDLTPGTEIFAMLGAGRGSYAEFVLVKRHEAALKPKNLTHEEAAAVPLAGLTAWQGLFDQGGLHEGQRVLIHGGTGGVGHFALQLAKWVNAYVVTTVSGEDKTLAHDLGADEAVDYQNERFEDVASDMDMVFDLIGGETRQRSWSVLKPGGIMVSTLGAPDEDEAKRRGVRTAGYMVEPNADQLNRLGLLLDEGLLKPVIQTTLPFTEAAAAQERLEKEHTRGKTVLEVQSG